MTHEPENIYATIAIAMYFACLAIVSGFVGYMIVRAWMDSR